MKNPKLLSSTILVLAFCLLMFALTKTETPKPVVDKEKIILKDSIIKLNARVDSLYDRLFIEQTRNGRFELSILHLMDVNPKAAREFNNFMDNETE